MIVFKNYFKIVKKYYVTVLLYTSIFFLFAIIFAVNSSGEQKDFASTKPNIAIINQDQDSLLTKTLVDYTKEHAIMKDLEMQEGVLKDALFYRFVDYIMIIPKGFGDQILKQDPIAIETMKIPDSYDSIYVEMLLNRFLNISSTYAKAGMTEEQIAKNVVQDMKEEAIVTLETSQRTDIENAKFYFNFANYTILAVCIFIIGLLLNTYHRKTIKNRNMVSATPNRVINRQLLLGNIVLTLCIWSLYIGVTFILYFEAMCTINGLMLILNSLLFSFTALALGTLIGNLVSNQEVQSAIVNVIALGSSFLCGAFVPQELLGENVLNIAKVIPSYWYISNNEMISKIATFTWDNVSPILLQMGIVVSFGIVFFLLSNFITKKKAA